MNYVTTNIRLPEDEYLRLKAEAARKRKSFAAVVREKLGAEEKVSHTTQKLLDLVDRAEEEGWRGPKDLAANHNVYFNEAYSSSKIK